MLMVRHQIAVPVKSLGFYFDFSELLRIATRPLPLRRGNARSLERSTTLPRDTEAKLANDEETNDTGTNSPLVDRCDAAVNGDDDRGVDRRSRSSSQSDDRGTPCFRVEIRLARWL